MGSGNVQIASISVWLTSSSLGLRHFLRSPSEWSQLVEEDEDDEMFLPTAGSVEVTQETTESVVIVEVFGAV